MKPIAIVDNTTDTLAQLKAMLKNAGYTYKVFDTDAKIVESEYSLLLLSGGLWYSDNEKNNLVYQAEQSFLQTTSLPVIGICLGALLIAQAYGGQLVYGARRVGIANITWQNGDDSLVYENNSMGFNDLPECFTTIADSPAGAELFKHNDKPIYGIQFHPEVIKPDNSGQQIFLDIVRLLIA